MIKHFENIRGNEDSKERICSFFASDYHFEMIALPYVEKEIKNNGNVVILTENDLNSSIRKVLSRTNLDEEEKEKIYNIDWSKNDENKLKNIEQELDKNTNVTVFIKGGEDYICKMDSSIQKLENLKIVHCYSLDEIGSNVSNVVKNYDVVLSTMGKAKM